MFPRIGALNGHLMAPAQARWLTVALLAATFLAACGDDSDPQAATPGVTSPSPSATSALTDAELASLLDGANDFVRSILEDGVVTASEYEQAVFRTVQCLDEQGVPHTEPILDLDRRSPRWDFSVIHATDDDMRRNSPIFDQCQRDFLLPVVSAWSVQTAPSEAEMQAIEKAILACVQAAGIEVQSLAEANTLLTEGLLSAEQQSARRACIAEHYLGIPPGATAP